MVPGTPNGASFVRAMVFSVLVGDRAWCRSVQVSGNRVRVGCNPVEAAGCAAGFWVRGQSPARSALGIDHHWDQKVTWPAKCADGVGCGLGPPADYGVTPADGKEGGGLRIWATARWPLDAGSVR